MPDIAYDPITSSQSNNCCVSFSAIFLIIRPTGALAVCAKIKHCKRTLVVIAVTNVFQLIITTVFRFCGPSIQI